MKNNKLIIIYTAEESTTKDDPFYLQNLMYDLPFDITKQDIINIRIIIPQELKAYIVDDLHVMQLTNNNLEFELKEKSQLTYQLFISNHHYCDSCATKDKFNCQNLPNKFSKKITINLIENEAQAYIKCHYLSDKKSEFIINTSQNHLASNTTSKLIVKSVLDNRAKLISNNTIHVPQKIKNVIAMQENKNLLLGNKAHVISIPQLKINSKQVKCNHGATISSINKEDLFYLQSRGIDAYDAECMLISAFLKY